MARRAFITRIPKHEARHIRLAGRMLGIPLYVEGKVVQREPPNLKALETIGEPHLLVIGRYRMTVSIDAVVMTRGS